MNKAVSLWLVIILALISTSCSSVVRAEQPAVLDSVILDRSVSYGQTFNAQFDGLDGIEIYLSPLEAGGGQLQLHLRADSSNPKNLAVVSLPLTKISTPGYYRFHIPIQTHSAQQSYYFIIKVKGSGSVEIGTAPGESYLRGALYQNNQPNDTSQMAFLLAYHLPRLGLGLVKEILLWGLYLFISAFLFIPPGWAILDFTFDTYKSKLDWGIKLALSVGISLALYPLVFMLSDSVEIHLGALIAWGFPLISLCLILYLNRKRLNRNTFQEANFRLGWIDITLFSILLIVFAARFWIVRQLSVPLWGDSLQHAMISQLILDNNGLFTSWQPYTPYYSLTTHFGFSLFTALFSWISGMNGTQASLWMGQIINGLAVLTLYPLAVKISNGNRWAGVGAIIIGGLVSTLPATYVNWGRYAQLAGQAILPVALWMLWDAIDNQRLLIRQNLKFFLLAGMVLTGMLLSYYRMPFYYATFVVVLLLFWGLPKWRLNWREWVRVLLSLSIIGLFSVILFLPWGARLLGSNLANAVEAGVTEGGSSALINAQLVVLQNFTDYLNNFAWVSAIIAIVLALFSRKWLVAALPLWFVFLIGYMTGASLKLPGANMLQGFAILIAIYIPVALLIGWLFGEIFSWLKKSRFTWIVAAISCLTILTAGWFGWQQRLLLDLPNYALVLPPDIRAMDWVANQTPIDSEFLVQGFEYWQTAAGTDAGWWMPLLASRRNMMPPQYAQFNEISKPLNYTKQVVDLVALLREKSITDPVSLSALCDWGITHIYHGQQQGKAGGPPLYSSSELQASPDLFTLIYHQDRVSIFTLNPTACNQ